MESEQLRKNVFTTIAYYDGMDYPMTIFEIWKYLTATSNGNEEISLLEILTELESDNIKNVIEEFQGFYFLKGRMDLVEKRLQNNKISNEKLRKVAKVARWLRCVPFVRMLAVTGSLAMKNAKADSDLDLLVVLKHGRIFTGRLLVTATVHFLGKRRHDNKISNRICLNYFITDRSLEINFKDLFSASEYSFILPIFGWHNFQKFQTENNWLKKYKPNFKFDKIPNLKFIKESVFSWRLRNFGELLLNCDFIENNLKKWQMRRIEANPMTHRLGSMVVANDEMLIFLPEPRGSGIFEKFKLKIAEFKR